MKKEIEDFYEEWKIATGAPELQGLALLLRMEHDKGDLLFQIAELSFQMNENLKQINEQLKILNK